MQRNLIAGLTLALSTVTFTNSYAATTKTADECQFIRDQLAAAAPGTTVEIPAGTYICQGPIVLDRDGVTLKGSARDEVTLKLADNMNSPLVVIGQATTPPEIVKNVTVRDLTLDGNMAHQQIECWGGPCDSGGTAYIRNNGVTVRGAHDALVENVHTFQNRSGGLVTERGTRRLTVRNFDSHHNFFDGLAGYETEDSVFADVKLHHNHYAGISVDLYFSKNHFENAHLYDNGDVGIYARWGTGNSFRGLLVENSGNHGIYLAHDGEYSKCANNYSFDGAEVRNNKGYGLWFNDAVCDGTTVQNSSFHGNAKGCYMVPEGGGVAISNTACEQ